MSLASLTASGSVSAQASPGETVSITITQPDGTTVSLTAQTAADGSYSASFTPTQTGGHTANFHIDADAQFAAADAPAFPFTVSAPTPTLEPRTLTGQVA